MIWFSQVAQQEDWQHGKQKKLAKSHRSVSMLELLEISAPRKIMNCMTGHTIVYSMTGQKPFDNAKITSIWNLAAEIIAEGVDARSAADAAYKSAVEKATEMGLISAKE